jgi:hypothetical protein
VSERLQLIGARIGICFLATMRGCGQAGKGVTRLSSDFLVFGELALGPRVERREKFFAKNVVKRGARMFLTQVIENAAKINTETMSLFPYAV